MKMDILLDKESRTTRHSFFCRLQNNVDCVVIKNAAQSPYAHGWAGYAPFESADGVCWQRTKSGHYHGTEFSFDVSKNAHFVCWFPPYPLDKIKKLAAPSSQSHQNMIVFGNLNLPKIVLLSGQHPAESMGLYFVEGVIKAIHENPDILKQFSFVIFPAVNLAGIMAHNHRLTPDGVDLNRSWNKNCKELENIKKEIKKLNNIYAVIDVHGDEVSKKDYVIYHKSLDKTFLFDVLKANNFELLPKQSYLKKLIKNIIRHKKIVLNNNATARDYFEKQGKTAITMELSAHHNTPQTCINKGHDFIMQILKH